MQPIRNAVLCSLLCMLPTAALSQDQAVYFNGLDQYAEFQLPRTVAPGVTAGAIELWLRPDRGAPASGARILDLPPQDPRQSILDLTSSQCAGPSLAIYLDYASGEPRLGLRLDDVDRPDLATIPNSDQWHFLAVTYVMGSIEVFLDGERQAAFEHAWRSAKVSVEKGPCLLAGSPQAGRYFRGAIDNLAIWNTSRTAPQIRSDMAGFPVLKRSETGLVAKFSFDEGTGSAFSNTAARSITGTLLNSPQWTRAIDPKPTLLSPGIWFVIQNKADVATDLELEPRRTALKSNGKSTAPSLDGIPLDGDYDQFLWRAVASSVTDGLKPYRLINKQSGESLIIACGPNLQKTGDGLGRDILLVNASQAGTNAYILTRNCLPSARALSIAEGRLATPKVVIGDPMQIWLFQPMSLVAGYHIPSAAPVQYPYTRTLNLPQGVKLRASNTVSEWAILNAFNIYANMFNAITNKKLQFRKDGPNSDLSRRTITMISEHDEMPCAYPDTWNDCRRVNDWRGYGGNIESASTMITEELMWRTGVYSRSFRDLTYSEFDQVVHEFGHTLNFQLFDPQNSDISAHAIEEGEKGDYVIEWFPFRVQRWFNSATFTGLNRSRLEDEARGADPTEPHRRTAAYLEKFFDPANSWAPPRFLRTVSVVRPYRFLISDTLIKRISVDPSHVIWSDSGNFRMYLQNDGNLVVTTRDSSTARWSSVRNLGAPGGSRVKGVWYRDGELVFLNTDDRLVVNSVSERLDDKKPTPEILMRIRVHNPGMQSSRLLVSDEGSAPQAIDVDGTTTLWAGARPR